MISDCNVAEKLESILRLATLLAVQQHSLDMCSFSCCLCSPHPAYPAHTVASAVGPHTRRQHMPNPSVVTNCAVPIMCYEQLLDQVVGGLEGFRWPKLDEGTPAGLCYTSGTTGNPKVGGGEGRGGEGSHLRRGMGQ